MAEEHTHTSGAGSSGIIVHFEDMTEFIDTEPCRVIDEAEKDWAASGRRQKRTFIIVIIVVMKIEGSVVLRWLELLLRGSDYRGTPKQYSIHKPFSGDVEVWSFDPV